MKKVPQPGDKPLSPPPATQRVPPGLSKGPSGYEQPKKIKIIKLPGNEFIHL